MPKFLIDESLSPKLARFLEKTGYDVLAVRDIGLKGKSDEEIVAWIKKNKRVIITCDKDFGEIYYLEQKGEIGVIVLKSRFQGLSYYVNILKFLHTEKTLTDEFIEKSLIVATETRIRKHQSENN